MKYLFLIAVGFLVGWAVTNRKILPSTADASNTSSSDYGAPVTSLTAGITDGGT
jgi:hypothetical protein